MLVFSMPGSLDALDHLTPALWAAGCAGLEERDGAVLAYFEDRLELPFLGEWKTLDDTDWLARYRASLQAVVLGGVTINPGGVALTPDASQVVVNLEPGLAFGTGQHETTRMAVLALQNLALPGKRVLDVGAGSGILAIVAAKLGAARVVGVDNDAQTVAVAHENAQQNGVDVVFSHGVLADVAGRFDVIVANLFAELHDALMPDYVARLEAGGRVVVTGIMAGTGQADAGESTRWDKDAGREALVLQAATRAGLRVVRRDQDGVWVLLELMA